MIQLVDLKHIGVKGRGYFCTIKKYIDETTGKEYALKELKKNHYYNAEYRYRLLREIKLLSELQGCDNVIKLVKYGNDEEAEELWCLCHLLTKTCMIMFGKIIQKLLKNKDLIL